jgi:hypothetical protein
MSVLTPGAKIVSTPPPPLVIFSYDVIFADTETPPLYFLESRFLNEY